MDSFGYIKPIRKITMLQKMLGASFDVKIGAILMTIGSILQVLADNNMFAGTQLGKYIAIAGAIFALFKAKSSSVTGTGNGAARVPDVNNVPINANPN